MVIIPLEMTQGDPFYEEIGLNDANGSGIDLAEWGIQIDFKLNLTDIAPLLSLTIGNGGLSLLEDLGAVSLQFDSTALNDIDINPRPRNGELIPSRIIYGDVKLTPPDGQYLVQGAGARTVIALKVYLGVTG